MDRSGAQSRAGTRKRDALGDGTARANIGAPATPPRASKSIRSTRSPSSATTSSSIPHHESMLPGGTLSVRNTARHFERLTSQASGTPPPEDLEENEDKRASQISASSQLSNWSSRKERVGPWILGKDIGRGMVGKVRKVKHYQTGQLAAAKIIPAKQANAMRAESLNNLYMSTANKPQSGRALPLGIEREVVIMRLLSHENIVRLYDIWENRGELYLIMELVEGGELFDYVTQYEFIAEDECVWIFRQIVAALLNAHRLGIYHRDLKPENILMSIQKDPETGDLNPQVKLADFGMAALQPKGKLLTTSCGSIHYAAPEVFERMYDGGKADVWSLGVILYVMLTGMLPFNDVPGQDFQVSWYRQIKSGQYIKPTWLTLEAQDLISRMLVSNPRHRISLENIWKHPLLEKWADNWQEPEEERNILLWIGKGPPTARWTVKTERDIEPEILQSLRVLWHSESEDVLKKRLLSNERNNLEKYFYAALQQHREEALENYSGPDTLIASASDYHHSKPQLDADSLPPLPASAYKRTKSSLSIMHDETPEAMATRQASTSPSERSYDPYRSSKNPIVSSKEHYSVTVHRGASAGHRRQPSVTQSTKNNSLRVDTLRKQQNRLSAASGSSRSRRASPSPQSAARRSTSRASISSSSYGSSPPGSIIVRPSSAHKRGVDFSHVRRSSTMSALSTPRSPSKPALAAHPSSSSSGHTATPRKANKNAAKSQPCSSASPPPPVADLLATLEKAKLRKSKTHSQVIDSEARKISVELEKFCEEAFNRDSSGSSYVTTTATTRAPSSSETPPSSISYRGSAGSARGYTTPEHRSWQHLDPSRETPNTFVATQLADIGSQLAATRRNLAERFARDKDASQNPHYREVMASLDFLLSKESEALQAESRRVVSAPEPSSGPLPMITEEEKAWTDEASSVRHSYGQTPTAASASRSRINLPPSQRPAEQPRQVKPSETIRIIDASSPTVTVAPLNIRKTSKLEPPARNESPQQIPAFSNSATLRYYNRFEPQPQYSSRRMPPVPPPSALDPISEDTAGNSATQPASNAASRRNGWFGGWKREPSAERVALRKASLEKFDVSRRPSRQASAETDLRTRDVSGPPIQIKSALSGKRPGFLSLFSRKKASKPPPISKPTLGPLPYTRRRLAQDTESRSENESNHSQTALSIHSSNASDDKPRRHGFYQQAQATRSRITSSKTEEEQSLGISRNWLERFFHIKPASQAMCFRTRRGLARQELVRCLRSWQSYGITDVVFDREKNLVFARVASDNYLRIKEVSFVVQLFVVLEHDRHNNLCVARFIQRKGAASSFRIVVAKIESAMRKKGFIVEDPVKKREMEEMVAG